MSSSHYDQNLLIPGLIKTIKYSFREFEFNEVEKVLTDKEINMKIEMKDLELENMELVDKLQKSQMKCEHLEEEINDLKSKNSGHERLMVKVYQEKVTCLDENEKLKGELIQLKEQNEDLKKENEKLTTRYNDLAQENKKLDGKLVKAMIEAIDQARMEGYTQAQQQVHEIFPKIEKDDLGGERLKQCGSKGLKGSGPHALKEQLMLGSGHYSKTTPSPGICDSNDEPVSCRAPNSSNTRANVGGEKETMFGKNKRKRREVRSTPKRKTSTCERSDDSLPIHKKDNEVVESDSEDESCSVSEDSNTHEPETNIKHTYQSKITPKRVKEVRKFAGIPPEYNIVIPSLEDRPNSPPPGFLCIYTQQIYGGLRFPIPPLFSDIACFFSISLSQLAPNAFRIIAGFAMAVLYLGEKPTARLFHSYFYPKSTEEGYFYFSSRHDAQFLKGFPKPPSAWKKYYFFISSPDQPWNFPTVWRDSLPEEKTNVINARGPAFRSLLDRLNKNPYNIYRLVDPALLYHFGLSPRVMRLSKTLDEIMTNNLMKEGALKSHKRRQENSSDTSSRKVVKEVVE